MRLSCIACCNIALVLSSLSAITAGATSEGLVADIVSYDRNGNRTDEGATLQFRDGTVRLEAPAHFDGYFLVDHLGVALFVRPAQKLYMDAGQSTPLTRIFAPVDATDPCSRWQASTSDSCKRIGAPEAGSATMAEYRLSSADHAPVLRWVDTHTGLVVRETAADGTTIALEHIRTAAQSADRFAIPVEFRKLDPQALIQRIKHSDVWVNTPVQ